MQGSQGTDTEIQQLDITGQASLADKSSVTGIHLVTRVTAQCHFTLPDSSSLPPWSLVSAGPATRAPVDVRVPRN